MKNCNYSVPLPSLIEIGELLLSDTYIVSESFNKRYYNIQR
jgi:hypothetical protein